MNLKKLQDADVKNKNILVRVDFNVSCDADGRVREAYKIAAAKETVDYLVTQGARCVALLTHFGRPKGTWMDAFSTAVIADDVEQILGRSVQHVAHYKGALVAQAVEGAKEGAVLLLENARFDAGETTNDAGLAADLAAPFDLFVAEDFGVAHRAHASTVGVAQHLPAVAGLWLQKEVEHLTMLTTDIIHPAVAIIGGSKIKTKLPLIERFAALYDTVLVGGRVAVEAQEQKQNFPDNVILPCDYTGGTLDIGPQTSAQFAGVIAAAQMIVWNGPMGKFEEMPYDAGTRAIVAAVADNAGAFSVLGGGESVQALGESGRWDAISFVSTGGGAMLAFLSGEDMPGLAVLLLPND